MRYQAPAAAVLLSAVALAATACGSSAADDPDGGISVVASTSAWAGVVDAIGGEQVEVTALIDSPVADPHSYESTAEDALKFTEADLAVVNGGGYDSFADGLAKQAPDVPVIDAFAVSGHAEEEDAHAEEKEHAEEEHADGAKDEHGHEHEHGGVNEHVWYDLHVVGDVAEQVADRLSRLAPEHEKMFQSNAKTFTEELATLESELESIGKGGKVLATEPVAHYLLADAGLQDVTPEAFSEAIEGDTDIPVAAQDEVNRLVEGKRVAAVVNNPQTETDVTKQLVAAAEKAGVPVVQISETPPEGESDYLKWVGGEVAELKAALAGG